MCRRALCCGVCKLASSKTMNVLNLSLLSYCVCSGPFTDISQIRIKESMLSMLTTKYVAEVTRWRNSQKEFKSVSTTKTKYRLQSYDPEISNDDVEKIMLSEGGVDKFIHAHIVGTGETQAIREAYTNAQVRLSMRCNPKYDTKRCMRPGAGRSETLLHAATPLTPPTPNNCRTKSKLCSSLRRRSRS